MESRITNITTGKTGQDYIVILEEVSPRELPHQVVRDFWEKYKTTSHPNNSVNGRMLEFIVCECLAHFGVGPIYFQAKFYNLENDVYDLASWTEEGYPIIISCKTSLRERWKQADLEGRLLKLKYPNAQSYLITLEKREATRRKRDIENGTVTGIDALYLADEPEFDSFVERMQRAGLQTVEPITPLEGKTVGG